MQDIPLFPVTVVGSLPRSKAVLKALGKRQKGLIGDKEFDSLVHEATLDALRLQEEAGVDIVTYGEQRRDNFYSFIAGHIEGHPVGHLSRDAGLCGRQGVF